MRLHGLVRLGPLVSERSLDVTGKWVCFELVQRVAVPLAHARRPACHAENLIAIGRLHDPQQRLSRGNCRRPRRIPSQGAGAGTPESSRGQGNLNRSHEVPKSDRILLVVRVVPVCWLIQGDTWRLVRLNEGPEGLLGEQVHVGSPVCVGDNSRGFTASTRMPAPNCPAPRSRLSRRACRFFPRLRKRENRRQETPAR